MRYGLRCCLAGALAAAMLAAIVDPSVAKGGGSPDGRGAPTPEATTLLSYNVEGLPWPFTHGRTDAAERIAAQLHALRGMGREPQVVAVQEAFGKAQKAIGAAAGYRYVAYGPDAAMVSSSPMNADERTFAAGASTLHGETEGAWEDSGLAIFSDYPILSVRRTPFPRYACAGYDCLANKGILEVALRVPGHAGPLIVIDTHLNSRTASGVDDERSFAAYRMQVDLLSGVVERAARSGYSVLLAGDFNVGDDPGRGRYLAAALDGLDRMRVGASEATCGTTCREIATVPSVARSKTIIFYRGSSSIDGVGRDFGSLRRGGRLSDHVGVMQAFDMRA